jgi:hypothetical protein
MIGRLVGAHGAFFRMIGLTVYLVRIRYREPTYAAYSGVERVYTAFFRVSAARADVAIARARDAFRRIERASSVSWIRQIVAVEAEPSAGVEDLDGAARRT